MFGSSLSEELTTEASLASLEKALKKFGYKVTRSAKSISASKRSVFLSRTETISINDKGKERICKWNSSAQSAWAPPKPGTLGKIISEAENMKE